MGDLNEALIDQSCLTRPAGCSTISSLADLSQLTPTQVEMLRRNPFVYDSLLLGQGGKRTISKVVPQLRPQHGGQPDLPEHRPPPDRIDRPGRAGRQHAVLKPRLEGIVLQAPHQPHLVRPARPGRVHHAGRAHHVAADLRAAVPRRRVQRARLRHPLDRAHGARGRSWCSAATRACCSTPSTCSRSPARCASSAFYDAGQVRDFGEPFAWKEDRDGVPAGAAAHARSIRWRRRCCSTRTTR